MGESDVDKQRATMTSDDQRPVAPSDRPGNPPQAGDPPATHATTGAKHRVWRRLQRLLHDDPDFNPTPGPSGNDARHDS